MVKKQLFQNLLQDARNAALEVKEANLRAEVFAVIASLSNDVVDFRAVNSIIATIGSGEFRSTAVAAIAKKLAQLKKFQQAREMVHSIRAVDNYWRAEAIARIALFSRRPADFGEARKYAHKINDKNLMAEVFDEISRFENHPEVAQDHFNEGLVEKQVRELVSDLIKINDFDRARKVAESMGSARLRAHAFAVMASILAEAIGE